MVKRQTVLVFMLGIVVGGASVAIASIPLTRPAFAATPPAADTRVFELRTYTVDPGQLPALLSRFRDHTIGIFNKHDMTSIGYWTPLDTALSKTTLIYILAHPSREAATKNWAAFRTDPEWMGVSAATAAAGLTVRKVESVFVEPTDFSRIK